MIGGNHCALAASAFKKRRLLTYYQLYQPLLSGLRPAEHSYDPAVSHNHHLICQVDYVWENMANNEHRKTAVSPRD